MLKSAKTAGATTQNGGYYSPTTDNPVSRDLCHLQTALQRSTWNGVHKHSNGNKRGLLGSPASCELCFIEKLSVPALVIHRPTGQHACGHARSLACRPCDGALSPRAACCPCGRPRAGRPIHHLRGRHSYCQPRLRTCLHSCPGGLAYSGCIPCSTSGALACLGVRRHSTIALVTQARISPPAAKRPQPAPPHWPSLGRRGR